MLDPLTVYIDTNVEIFNRQTDDLTGGHHQSIQKLELLT